LSEILEQRINLESQIERKN